MSLTTFLTFLRTFPSVLVFHGHLQLTPSIAMELCCVAGALLAFIMMIFRAMRCTLLFAVLWFLYLSVYKVCINVHHSKAVVCVCAYVCACVWLCVRENVLLGWVSLLSAIHAVQNFF